MADLTRTRSTETGVRTRVIFVRQPVKDVRREHERDLLPLRLFIGVIVALGTLGTICLLGYLGFHMGFARSVGMSGLTLPAGGGLVAGLHLLACLPAAVLAAALAEPMWLMLGFLLIAIPAASMAVIGPPQTPGGPRPHVLTVVFSFTGAIATGVLSLLLVWWTVLPFRAAGVVELPGDTASFENWLTTLRVIVGLDALAVVAASLWMVLIMRLAVPRWLKGLGASAIFASLVIVVIAMSMSAGTLSQVQLPRSVVGDALILGRVEPGRVAMMRRIDESLVRSIEALPQRTEVNEQSVESFLR